MGDRGTASPQGSVDRTRMKRGTQTAVACEACRRRKCKCDGRRPTCSRCQARNVAACVYEIGLDGSKIQQLRRRNQHLAEEVAQLQSRLDGSAADAGPDDAPTDEPTDGERGQQDGSPVDPEAHRRGAEDEGAGDDRVAPEDRPPGGEGPNIPMRARKRLSWDDSVHDSRPTPSLPAHFIQPRAQRHDSPISKVYSSFREFAQQAIANGESDRRVLGSFELNAGVIFSNGDFKTASFLSQWAGQVVSAWGLQSLAPKLGMMYMLFMLMRWQVSSSSQDFREMPEIMKPTPTQLSVPHPPFIDFLVWPFLRDLFICEPQTYESLAWVEHIAPKIDLARGFTVDEALYVDPSTGHFRLNPTFRQYIEDVEHWTLDRTVADLIPQVRGHIRLR